MTVVATINYVERCFTKGKKTTFELVPEVTVTTRSHSLPAKASEMPQNRR